MKKGKRPGATLPLDIELPALEEPRARFLREALSAYIDLPRLRDLAASGGDLTSAIPGGVSPEIQALLAAYASLFAPSRGERITSPHSVAAMLMAEMGFLDQEHLRVVLLDTKHRVQGIPTVYVGSLHSAVIRVGEVFKEAIRRNSAALIVVHNHPSGDPTPSPEDIEITRQIVKAGKLLDVDVLDHLVIGRGQYVSLRERGLI